MIFNLQAPIFTFLGYQNFDTKIYNFGFAFFFFVVFLIISTQYYVGACGVKLLCRHTRHSGISVKILVSGYRGPQCPRAREEVAIENGWMGGQYSC